MILICYDGSPDSKAAIELGGELFKGQPATVVSVWQPFVQVMLHAYAGFGLAAGFDQDQEEIDRAAREHAERRAQEGAEIASSAGFDASHATRSQETTTAEAILSEADAIGASAILMGSRGLGRVKSMLLGSVSHGVLQNADRTVIVVPSPEVVEARRRERAARSGA
jgi:nucleotide-binding universal stress UspA family protein